MGSITPDMVFFFLIFEFMELFPVLLVLRIIIDWIVDLQHTKVGIFIDRITWPYFKYFWRRFVSGGIDLGPMLGIFIWYSLTSIIHKILYRISAAYFFKIHLLTWGKVLMSLIPFVG
ncbi:YggT family protein [Chlamydiia bacterium]|nr:YggT family protein [Chlamydiia bacterium]